MAQRIFILTPYRTETRTEVEGAILKNMPSAKINQYRPHSIVIARLIYIVKVDPLDDFSNALRTVPREES